MDNLTTKQVGYLNNVTNRYDLGTKLQEVIDHAKLMDTGAAPVNAVAATKVLTLTGVVVDGQTVTLNNPAVAGSDVYEFLSDTEQTKTAETNIAVNITASTTKSARNLTVDTQPTSGDTMTIGEKVYTFVPDGTDTADGEISIGTDLATAQAAIVSAINGTDDVNEPHPLVSAGDFADNVSAITALVGGVSGDSIATTETFTAGTNVFAGETLTGGADCSADNAITALVAAVTASDTQGVGAADGAGDTVNFTADVRGVAGNAITVAETLANGSFSAGSTFAGGVDGTPGAAHEVRSDASYFYVCVAANTITGANWRRVSLGAVY